MEDNMRVKNDKLNGLKAEFIRYNLGFSFKDMDINHLSDLLN